MKNIVAYSLLSVALLMSACSEEDYQSAQSLYNDGEVHEITAISGKFDLDSIASRTIIAMSDSSIASPVWAANDTIGIYPDAGDQLSFPIVDGVGTNTCVFNGGGWALKSSSTYTAYSPFNRMYYFVESNALPVSMLGQKQKGNDNSEHLGAYDLQIAKGTAPASGKISFSFKHQVAIVRLDLTAPVTASWASVSLESDADFTLKATMDLTLETPALSVDSTANCFTLELEDVKTTADSTLITAYMMLLPVDFTDKSLSVRLTDVDGNSYTTDATIVRDKTNFVASAARWITANFLEDDIPYVTFTADAEQTLTMSQAVETLEYSVGNREWAELGTTTVTFGGDNGTLRLRGKSAIGTASSYTDYSQISFGNETSVACSGDIRTLIDYENYNTANTENALFSHLFNGCTALTSAPELPITTLAVYCYKSMFHGCSNLISAPALPATTLAYGCYDFMFYECSSLTTAPELPATTLEISCYSFMFYGCTSLETAPALPATELAETCYDRMFYGCTSLISAPELPATTLKRSCYGCMFMGCTSLTTAPELPATTLAESCYLQMFCDCSSLNDVTMLATDISATDCLSNWLSGVSSTGTFVKASTMTSLPEGASGIPTGWTVKDYDTTPYVTFTAGAEQSLTLSQAVETLEYSVGNGDWATLGTTTVTFGGSNGRLRLRGKSSIGTAASTDDYNNYSTISFGNEVPVACSGDIRTLVDYENYATANTSNARFRYLFKNCTSLTTPPDLPAETLANHCYANMFYGCSNLTEAPELPAKTVPTGGYYHMFENCSNLKTAPELPATTVGTAGYNTMFMNCTSLVNAPELPATTLEGENHYACMFMNCTSLKNTPKILPSMTATMNCYANMFDGCINITSAPELPATTLQDWCYEMMFQGCINLINIPKELPAKELTQACYKYMFSGCKKLQQAPKLSSTTLAEYCYSGMFGGCTSLESAPELPATELVIGCYDGMFANCTNLKVSPKLEAETLVSSCYQKMFSGCTNLNEITMLATDISAYYCLDHWVEGVASSGTFYKLNAMTSLVQDEYDYDGIPIGNWEVRDIDISNGDSIVK